MKIVKKIRIKQKRRWKPRFADIFRRAFRKHAPQIATNADQNNAFLQRIVRGEYKVSEIIGTGGING